MKIALLDSYLVDFDGLSWSALEGLGEVVAYPRTNPREVLQRTEGCTAIVVNKVCFGEELFSQLPELKYIGVSATGTNNIDLEAARAHSIAVSNVPGYSTESVAQLVFAYLFELCNRVSLYDHSVKQGDWTSSEDFSYCLTPLRELNGKSIGIIGYGAIGRAVGRIASAIGMEVLIAGFSGREYAEPRLSIEQVFRKADVVTLHCPLTPATQFLVNREHISLMKESAILINTARGGLVAEDALAEALHQGQIAYACVDVLSTEPPCTDNPLLSAPNTTITPHIAWGTREARERLVKEVVENFKAFLGGKIRNRVELLD